MSEARVGKEVMSKVNVEENANAAGEKNNNAENGTEKGTINGLDKNIKDFR